jgi:hypothetical protein
MRGAASSNEQKTIVAHLHEGFEDTLMLESGSALILRFASLPGTVRVDITLGLFTRNDLDTLERRESLLGRFAGDRPIVSTLLGALVDSWKGSSESWRRLDRLLAFSLRVGPIFDRRREFLDCAVVRVIGAGMRRVGLPSRSRYFGMCMASTSPLFMLRSESGGPRRTGELSSAS